MCFLVITHNINNFTPCLILDEEELDFDIPVTDPVEIELEHDSSDVDSLSSKCCDCEAMLMLPFHRNDSIPHSDQILFYYADNSINFTDK